MNNARINASILLVFLFIVAIICGIIIAIKPGQKPGRGGKEPDYLSPGYYDRKPTWSKSEGANYGGNNDKSNLLLTDSSDEGLSIFKTCKTYTYQNNIGVNKNPNLKTVFQDVLDGIAFETPSDTCLQRNQIQAYYGEHTCESNNGCIDFYGNYLTSGLSESYPIDCQNIPYCKGMLTNISFNFSTYDGGLLSKNSLFLQLNKLRVNSATYGKLDKNSFFFKQGFFIEDSKLDGKYDGIYYPFLTNNPYSPTSPYQLFEIFRYSYDKDSKSLHQNDNGYFSEIRFNADINLYLTADDLSSGTSLIFKEVDNSNSEARIQWLLMPPLKLTPQIIPSATKFSAGYIPFLSTNPPTGVNPFPDFVWPEYKSAAVGSEVTAINDRFNPYYISDNQTFYFAYNQVKGTYAHLHYPKTVNTDNYPLYKYNCVTKGECTVNMDFSLNFSAAPPYTIDGKDHTFYGVISTGVSALFNSNSIGNLVKDNQAVWLVKDSMEGLAIFEPSYFTVNALGTKVIKLSQGQQITTPGLNYKIPLKGLVVSVDISSVNYDPKTLSDINEIIQLNSTNTTLTTSDRDPAEVLITTFSAVDENGDSVTELQKIEVIITGSNYTNKAQAQSFTINSSAIGGGSKISNLILKTIPQSVIYEGVSPSTSDLLIEFKNDDAVKSDGTLNFSNVINPPKGPYNGRRYESGYLTYINQLDGDGKSLLGTPYDQENILNNYKNLAYMTVETANITGGTCYPAPHNLLRTNNVLPNSYTLTDKILANISLWDDSKGVYNNSPPQIAYIGQGLLSQLKTTVTDADSIASFFSSLRQPPSGDIPYTGLDYIKTLQFTNLNYIGYSSKEYAIKNPTNNIIETDQLVLGRFIPYSSFKPTLYEFIDSKNQFIEGKTVFFNDNYAQFVPYGLENIYQNNNILTNLPVF